MRKTDKVFLRYEEFPYGAGLDGCLILWYRNCQEKINRGELGTGKFYLNREDSRQFLKGDLDSWHYFQNKLPERMKEYQTILLDFVDMLKPGYIDGGWDEEATDVARHYCWDMEGIWRHIECYQMIPEDWKGRI